MRPWSGSRFPRTVVYVSFVFNGKPIFVVCPFFSHFIIYLCLHALWAPIKGLTVNVLCLPLFRYRFPGRCSFVIPFMKIIAFIIYGRPIGKSISSYTINMMELFLLTVRIFFLSSGGHTFRNQAMLNIELYHLKCPLFTSSTLCGRTLFFGSNFYWWSFVELMSSHLISDVLLVW